MDSTRIDAHYLPVLIAHEHIVWAYHRVQQMWNDNRQITKQQEEYVRAMLHQRLVEMQMGLKKSVFGEASTTGAFGQGTRFVLHYLTTDVEFVERVINRDEIGVPAHFLSVRARAVVQAGSVSPDGIGIEGMFSYVPMYMVVEPHPLQTVLSLRPLSRIHRAPTPILDCTEESIEPPFDNDGNCEWGCALCL